MLVSVMCENGVCIVHLHISMVVVSKTIWNSHDSSVKQHSGWKASSFLCRATCEHTGLGSKKEHMYASLKQAVNFSF